MAPSCSPVWGNKAVSESTKTSLLYTKTSAIPRLWGMWDVGWRRMAPRLEWISADKELHFGRNLSNYCKLRMHVLEW